MHQPRTFVETDLAALDALIGRDNFITLVTVSDGHAEANHLPVLYHRDGDRVQLQGHVSRANPVRRTAGRCLAIVHGPNAYVSPGWYPDKEEEARVPTWNYAVAHLEGVLEFFTDEGALAGIVDRLSLQHEAAVGSDWRFEMDREDHRNQLRGIVGFRVEVARITMKFKLNQNHPQANRVAVSDQLAISARESSRDTAELMRARLAAPIAGD